MEVRRLSLLEGARQAEGVVVIIDVFRAFSMCAYAAALGARPLVATADAAVARGLKARHPDAVLSGEVDGWPIEGFDLGNSPTELLRRAAAGNGVVGRPFVQRTSAGTQGLMAASRARALFVASMVNARATAQVIAGLRPSLVTLVPMGNRGREPAVEDEQCADALQAYLTGHPWDAAQATATLYASPRVRWLLSGGFAPFWPSDVPLCLAFDLFPFALRARRAGPVAVIRPVWAAREAPPRAGRRPAGGAPRPPRVGP